MSGKEEKKKKEKKRGRREKEKKELSWAFKAPNASFSPPPRNELSAEGREAPRREEVSREASRPASGAPQQPTTLVSFFSGERERGEKRSRPLVAATAAASIVSSLPSPQTAPLGKKRSFFIPDASPSASSIACFLQLDQTA